MANMKEKYVSPIGECLFVHLNEPDFKYKKEDGEYHATMSLDDDTTLVPRAHAMLKAEFGKPKPNARPFQLPFVDGEDGKVNVKFKSDYAPHFFDSRGKMIKAENVPKIYQQSKLKIGGVMKTYDISGMKGVSFKLNKVQIVEIAEPVSDFEDLGDGYVAEAAPQGNQPEFDQDFMADDSDF